MRSLVAATHPPRRYTPSGDAADWDAAEGRLARG
jgi:hypothetical protein